MSTVSTAPQPVAPAPASPSKSARARRSRGIQVLRYGLLLFFLVIVMMPVYVLLVTSFKGPGDASPDRAWLPPTELHLDGWRTAWEQLSPALGRTFALVIPASLISACLGAMNGFVLSRWRFPGANLVFTLILFGMFIPYQAVMIPLIELMQDLGVQSGVPSLIVLHVVFGLPITTLIFRNYYAGVPQEMIEAARVDGAGMLRTFRSVVLPLSVPAFVVTLIWQFTSAWNDYLFALFFSNARNGPVTISLNFLASGQLQDYSASMAGALIASFPTLIVYIVLGRWFLGGLMAGSLKG
ncbi:carbohydrate ABC transporter membrane protein 2, CUT1 family [Streptomyces zhaozhouensis]|uniref:Carbohydrate ABC transporter membrane protein 2, CUT1 family n=1 Tax=Streptomyces zhaozhouensis TaxID=1300267 RepID=A0A286DZP5_9ACTN|nr:carbohydrate ABC transporter permease [Streptomyces zhaozhouensis]SOD64126.1 carbohydrate ABC transporter membrane protein 2, CUT1 family [Streptomyces zhaozhouensis]